MTTAIIGTGGIGSVVARPLASGGETLRLSSADIGHCVTTNDRCRDRLLAGPGDPAQIERARDGVTRPQLVGSSPAVGAYPLYRRGVGPITRRRPRCPRATNSP